MLNSLTPTDHERISRAGALAVAVVAAVVCLYLLVRIAWLFVPHRQAAAPPLPGAAAPAPASPGGSVAKWHLFGNPQNVVHPAPSSLQTVLKLGLRGTLALPDPKDARSVAIIADEHGAESSYRIGDPVAGGATLAEVYTDHVVLDHQGVAETLEMPRPEQHAPPLPERNRQRLTSASATSIPPGFLPHSTAASSRQPPAAAQHSRIDAQELASQIRPVFGSDGRIVGANISGADAATLARVGLKPTDVVTAINGTPLASVSNPQALMDQLRNSSSIRVTVQRDGRPATLTLSLR